jgi:hypothetical protein
MIMAPLRSQQSCSRADALSDWSSLKALYVLRFSLTPSTKGIEIANFAGGRRS